ncbi:MAG: carboxypeptidase-like regulatory domain-containing protein [Pirellulaceae bacterium]
MNSSTLTKRSWSAFVVILIFIAGNGCGSGPEGIPDGAPVTGVVTYNGSPVSGATVTFHPKSGDRAAVAQTDAAGIYQLTTQAANDGALPGDYVVTVTKIEFSGGTELPEDHPDYGKAPASDESEAKSLVPQKYGDPKTSDLAVTVQAGENNIPLELAD